MGTVNNTGYTQSRPEYWVRTSAEALCVEVDDILGTIRTKEMAAYRHAAMWVARTMTGWSYPALARAFQRSDHTTVMNGINHAEKDEYVWPLIEEIFEFVEAQ